jgi:hypothetical protein
LLTGNLSYGYHLHSGPLPTKTAKQNAALR